MLLLPLALALALALARATSPVGTVKNGTCGATSVGPDCNTAPKGSFPGLDTMAACVAKLKGCKMANYVSFSPPAPLGWGDCSWYNAASCDFDHLCSGGCATLPPSPAGCPMLPTLKCSFTSEVLKTPGPSPGPSPPGPPLAPRENVTVNIDWSKIVMTANTSATVEVDVMPFLSRVENRGGSFDAYYSALTNLGSAFVRFSPWFPYPQVVVPELTPSDCTATKPATNWNSTLFDGIVRDFMAAVCGDDAVSGNCANERSVAQQLSTMPDWLYKDAYPVPPGIINDDPWEYNGFTSYNRGTSLVNESCVPLAKYMARVVSHYTNGGHTDECGHWHPSGFHYDWAVLSVLNENEHNTGQSRYTICYDAIRTEVRKFNTRIQLAGPEVVGASYAVGFLDPANHAAGAGAPDIMSHHAFLGYGSGSVSFAPAIDKFMTNDVLPLVQQRNKVAPETPMVLNEWIPFLTDWCDPDDAAALFEKHGDNLARDPRAMGCPNWQDPKTTGLRANRATLGWNNAASAFAYGYGRLALQGYKYVGADQLIGGPWPDNEPAVSCLDWTTGQENAKYWSIHMLAHSLGTDSKDFAHATYTRPKSPLKGPVPVPPPGPMPKSCHVAPPGTTYKWGAGNLFPNKPHHGGNWGPTMTSPAQCCALCQSFKNCSYWTYSAGGTPTKPICYAMPGGCCFMNTADGAAGKQMTCPVCTAGSAKALPPPTGGDLIFALPFSRKDAKRCGVLLVSKVAAPLRVSLVANSKLRGGSMFQNASANVLDGTVDGVVLDSEPGFVPPVARQLDDDGTLLLGPFGVAIVDVVCE